MDDYAPPFVTDVTQWLHGTHLLSLLRLFPRLTIDNSLVYKATFSYTVSTCVHSSTLPAYPSIVAVAGTPLAAIHQTDEQ